MHLKKHPEHSERNMQIENGGNCRSLHMEMQFSLILIFKFLISCIFTTVVDHIWLTQ